MNKEPLVSIVMNCLNCSDFLESAIDSVYDQTYENWEIIFWDNFSCDNSSSIAKSYDSKLRYFKADKTTPLYEARNFALEKCKGDLIAFLDCDDLWTKNKLALQVQQFSISTPIVYSRFIFIDEKSHQIKTKLPNKSFNKKQSMSSRLLENNPISISGVLIEAKLLKQEKFKKVFNLLGDFELWFRLSLHYDFIFVDEVLEFSRQHSKTTSLLQKDKWIIEQRIFYKEYMKSNEAKAKVGLKNIIIYAVKCELLCFISRLKLFFKENKV